MVCDLKYFVSDCFCGCCVLGDFKSQLDLAKKIEKNIVL